jgi:hypothetical protein
METPLGSSVGISHGESQNRRGEQGRRSRSLCLVDMQRISPLGGLVQLDFHDNVR